MTSDELRSAIYQQLEMLRSGSLTFWGNWFGRPHDNIHRIVGADSSEGTAVIYFDHAETLIIDGPGESSLDGGTLRIQSAECVRFQWFYYGRLPSRETLQFDEYRWVSGQLRFSTNFMPDKRRATLDPHEAAVQLHSVWK
jgi:hypothetical protein